MMLKPSAAPSANQSSMMSATCSGVPAKVKWPRAPARLASSCRRLGVPRGKAAADVGRSGLDQHRSALRRARQVQRPSHVIVLTLVVDRPDAVHFGIAPAGAVVEHRVLGPAIPQPLDHGHELFAL